MNSIDVIENHVPRLGDVYSGPDGLYYILGSVLKDDGSGEVSYVAFCLNEDKAWGSLEDGETKEEAVDGLEFFGRNLLITLDKGV